MAIGAVFVVRFMKKNNKYRSNNNYNNNNNQIFSLNYKFDSISPAGKISGTALDLIKRYNELAKEAQGNADYVEAENFRQYAEHYRKIVTEINERKVQRFGAAREENAAPAAEKAAVPAENLTADSGSNEIPAPGEKAVLSETETSAPVEAPAPAERRSFKVIEINPADAEKPVSQTRSRIRAPRKPKAEAAVL